MIWEYLRGVKGGGIDSREEWVGGVRRIYDKDALFTCIKLSRNEENSLLKIPALALSHFFQNITYEYYTIYSVIIIPTSLYCRLIRCVRAGCLIVFVCICL